MKKILRKRSQTLVDLSRTKVLVLDGAMGSQIQKFNLSASDFGGEAYDGCNEYLVHTKPEVIEQIHTSYLDAGCDIIETNTFGGTPIVLGEYGLTHLSYELNKSAAELARKATDKYAPSPRFVAGSIGPTTKSLCLTGGITFEELSGNYLTQVRGLYDGGVDYFLIETCPDNLNVKAALLAIDKLFEEVDEIIPIAISGTIETMGTLLGGQTIEAFLTSHLNRNLFYIGVNCSTGPEFMTDYIRSLSEISPFQVACVPNAGLPNHEGQYLETPEMMCSILKRFLERGWLNIIGGCCGTNEKHIEAFSALATNYKPRPLPTLQKSFLSGLEHLEVSEEIRPVLVGERTNVIGSKKFKTLLQEGKFEEAAEIGRAQFKSGAQIIDVCVSHPDSNELYDMEHFISQLVKLIKVPIMIDSTDEAVMELALKHIQGKAILNSVNLEDGEKRFDKVIPLIKKYGAAIVVGTIDEDPENGMAVTKERKLEIAKRSFDLLVNQWNIAPQDIYFDPLVFPCAVGDEKYRKSAYETIEGLRLIKREFPYCKSVLGISNVSFGLPVHGREVLNSVFLNHCVLAGLDLAIVNSEKIERFTHLSPHEINLSEGVLFDGSQGKIQEFITYFQSKSPDSDAKSKQKSENLSVDEKIAACVIEGTKEGLVHLLDEKMKSAAPLEIINGPLMNGMDQVGRLFNDKKLIVAEVLQSAEVMKMAVSHLERFMDKSESNLRGKVLLATVKGDVHDIGKNLVDIILSNNGFQVIDLGIKVPPEVLIQKFKEHQPDIIGLSGLLVKSAHQMVATAEDLKQAGIQIPILVGGAALSKIFTENKIQPAYENVVLYASDAMKGLELAKQIMEGEGTSSHVPSGTLHSKMEKPLPSLSVTQTMESPLPLRSSTKILSDTEIPQPPHFNRTLLQKVSQDEIVSYINPLMLYSRHLGCKGSSAKLLLSGPSGIKELQKVDPKTFELFEKVEQIKKRYKDSEILSPKGVYQFFKSFSDKNKLLLCSDEKNSKILTEFEFVRQSREPYLCISDYVKPFVKMLSDKPSDQIPLSLPPFDNVALFVVTAGKGIREEANRLKEKGDYLESHILQALALETAEAFAEYLHRFIRTSWGFPDPTEMTMMERFQAKYRGKRYSFGYPACPRLEDQKILFHLLKPEEVGIHLTETMMMDPEASVSAIVFHHPEAIYFSVENPI